MYFCQSYSNQCAMDIGFDKFEYWIRSKSLVLQSCSGRKPCCRKPPWARSWRRTPRRPCGSTPRTWQWIGSWTIKNFSLKKLIPAVGVIQAELLTPLPGFYSRLHPWAHPLLVVDPNLQYGDNVKVQDDLMMRRWWQKWCAVGCSSTKVKIQ